MPMSCELCGRDCKVCRPALIDGVKMMLCQDCIKYGEGVKEVPTTSPKVQRAVVQRPKKPGAKDIYKDMDKELVSNWPQVIKEARKKKGLTREQLGFRIGERTVTISKIENGDLRPSDKMISKLEKELEISLLEEVKDVSLGQFSHSRLTLGDFIRTEK